MSMRVEEIDIQGTRGGTSAPPTWAQHEKWDTLQGLASRQGSLNTLLELPLPPSTDVSTGLSALTQLVEECETLRTTYSEHTGELRQTVRAGYSMPVALYDVPPGEGVDEVIDEALPAGMDCTSAPPVRAVFFKHRGRLDRAFLISSPIVSDATGGSLLRQRYLGHVRQRPLEPLGYQPLDHAVYERSEAGRRSGTRGLRHWEDRLSRISAPLVPACGGRSSKTLRMHLASPAALRAVDRFVLNNKSIRSAVYFGALAHRLGRHFDSPQCPLPVMSSNRNRAETAAYIGVLAQRSIALFDCGEEGLIADSGTANREVLLSLRNGTYDPTERNAIEQRIADQRGFRSDSFLYHANYLRVPRERTENILSPADIFRLGNFSELEEEPAMDMRIWHFLIQFMDNESDVGISMFANSSTFSLDEMRGFLAALEQDLISLALRS